MEASLPGIFWRRAGYTYRVDDSTCGARRCILRPSCRRWRLPIRRPANMRECGRSRRAARKPSQRGLLPPRGLDGESREVCRDRIAEPAFGAAAPSVSPRNGIDAAQIGARKHRWIKAIAERVAQSVTGQLATARRLASIPNCSILAGRRRFGKMSALLPEASNTGLSSARLTIHGMYIDFHVNRMVMRSFWHARISRILQCKSFDRTTAAADHGIYRGILPQRLISTRGVMCTAPRENPNPVTPMESRHIPQTLTASRAC